MVTAERESGDGAAYLIRPRDGEDGAGELAGCAGLDVDWTAPPPRHARHVATKAILGTRVPGERAAALFRTRLRAAGPRSRRRHLPRDNEKSRRAIEKYVEAHGGTYEGLIRNELVRDGDGPADVHRYSVTREE